LARKEHTRKARGTKRLGLTETKGDKNEKRSSVLPRIGEGPGTGGVRGGLEGGRTKVRSMSRGC
jgi:hypothetical protein